LGTLRDEKNLLALRRRAPTRGQIRRETSGAAVALVEGGLCSLLPGKLSFVPARGAAILVDASRATAEHCLCNRQPSASVSTDPAARAASYTSLR